VINIGLGPLSTHSAGIPTQAALRSFDIDLPLIPPATMAIDPLLDAHVGKNCFMHPMWGEPLPKRIAHAIKRAIEESIFRRRDVG